MLVHAAGESAPGDLPPTTYAVVLAVPTESELARVADLLERKDIAFVAIREPDPPWSGQLMALGCRPGEKGVVGRWLSHLPLLR